MNAIRLTSVDLNKINEKLQKLVTGNTQMPELAYATNTNTNIQFACRGCDGGCKGSCSGGCTSW